MTLEYIKTVREQAACRDCMMRPMEQSRFALRNAQYCDNCLQLVEVRFGLIHDDKKRACRCGCHVGGEGATTACGCCYYPNVRTA